MPVEKKFDIGLYDLSYTTVSKSLNETVPYTTTESDLRNRYRHSPPRAR